MISTFNRTNLRIPDIDLCLDDLLGMLHEEDCTEDNPVVNEAKEVFQQLPDIADIRGGYAICDDIERFPGSGEIRIENQLILCSRMICGFMAGAEYIAVFVCTAGKGFTDYSKKYTKEGEFLKAFIVDTLGSLVAEKSIEHIQAKMENEMALHGLKITNGYSPGYCNWPVDDQKKLFSLLPDNICDITLTPSCMMNPVKSVSGIIGIGKSVKKSPYACDICDNRTCVYRKVRNKNIQL